MKFLKKNKLEKYAQTLFDNGFDDMDILMEISTEHVSDLKISPRSARKLLREVQKSK